MGLPVPLSNGCAQTLSGFAIPAAISIACRAFGKRRRYVLLLTRPWADTGHCYRWQHLPEVGSSLCPLPSTRSLTPDSSLAAKLSAQPMFASRAHELAKDATSLVQWMKNAPPGDARNIMRSAYTDSLRLVYIVMAAFAFVASVLSLCVKHYNLDRALETEQYLVENEETNCSRV
jgi:hypothetical protein